MAVLLVVPLTTLAVSAFHDHARAGVAAGIAFVVYGAAFLAHDMPATNAEILMALPGAWALVLLRRVPPGPAISRGLERLAACLLPFPVVTAPLWWGSLVGAPLHEDHNRRRLALGLVALSIAPACLGFRFFPHYFVQAIHGCASTWIASSRPGAPWGTRASIDAAAVTRRGPGASRASQRLGARQRPTRTASRGGARSMSRSGKERSVRVILLSCLACLSSPALGGDGPVAPRGWRLVFDDEFDGASLSAARWNVLVREQSKHGELQYYVPDEAYVENGSLRLRSRRRDFGRQRFTSGRVDTSGKFAAVYGRFEVRAKLPRGRGLWPAHWLYPQNRDWAMERLMARAIAEGDERLIPEARPWYSEIDIMELLGHEPTVVYGTLHYHSFAGEKRSSSGALRGVADYSQDFHVYTLEWDPDEIRWYVDGRLVHATKDGVPHVPHYLVLNTAVGGEWPGSPDETTTFPQFHDVDYVRVYQRERYFAGEE